MKSVWSREEREVKNRTLAFVYDYVGDAKSVRLRICAANVFRLFLNGKLFGYGPRRSAHGYSNINEYAFLLNNKDRIVVEVAGYCVNSYYIVNELPFFACELDCNGTVFAQATDFSCFELNDRVRKVQRYSFQRPFTEVYRMQEDRRALYCGKIVFPQCEICEVESSVQQECDLPLPTFEQSDCVEIERGSVGTAETFYLHTDRSISRIGERLLGYPYDELECKLSDEACAFSYHPDENTCVDLKNRYCLYDFSRIVTGFISCRVTVSEHCDLYFLFDEILWDEVYENETIGKFIQKDCKPLIFYRMGSCSAIKYTLEPGEYDLLGFEPHEMRYLKAVCLGGSAQIHSVGLVRYENPDIYRTKFVCDDSDLQKIFEASQHTLSQNAVDVLTDCPGRERAGWLCDSFFSSRAEQLLTGENRVEHNLLDAYLKAPQSPFLPEGMLPMCYPSDHNDGNYIPNWAMWLFVELEDYVRRTGDTAMAQAFRPKAERLLEFFRKFENSDGLLEKLQRWVCVEHSKAAEFVQDVNYPTNMLYSKMYRSIGTLYGLKDALCRADEIAETIRQQSFNGTFFEDNRVRVDGILQKTGNMTETCQYYAFFMGIASKQTFPALYERMLHEFGPDRDCEKVYPNVYKSNAFIGNYLRLLYFYENGEKEEVFNECKDYFLYMANRTMTLWEHDSPLASCDHAFASYPVVFFANALTGFTRFDSKAKEVWFERPTVQKNCTLRVPLERGKFAVITVKDGVITRELPEGYTVRFAE